MTGTPDMVALTEQPFTVYFSWNGKNQAIKFKNGEDVFKLAEMYKRALDRAGIEYFIEEEREVE